MTKKMTKKSKKEKDKSMTSGQLKPRKKQKKLTLKKRIEIYQHLATVVKPIEETEFWEYTQSHSDHTVAENFDVPLSSVRAIRVEMLGELRDRPTKTKISVKEVAILIGRIGMLEREMTVTNTKLNLLAGSMKVDDWSTICKTAESITSNSESLLAH